MRPARGPQSVRAVPWSATAESQASHAPAQTSAESERPKTAQTPQAAKNAPGAFVSTLSRSGISPCRSRSAL